MSQQLRIAVTSTFTAEPIEESLAFWMEQFNWPCEIEFAPYNQVFQQLLDPSSLLSTNQNGVNVVLVRVSDLLGSELNGEAAVRDFVRAVRAATDRSSTPLIISLCPTTSDHTKLEELIVSELADVQGVQLVTSNELFSLYPVDNYDDPYADKIGKVPYTRAFFTALGTIVARKIHTLRRLPHKVIVLDCDQTLWKGVCGEVGASGIEINSQRKLLQEFVVAQHSAGMLLSLCSKNNEEDVVNVFECRSDMPLKREHLVCWRINWKPKSENLKSLADELQLGLDSFIFLDDDPVTCAEVQANCPDVLVLQLPEDESHYAHFLNHVWAFDHLKSTEEDQKRTLLYRQNVEREQFRAQSLNFAEFLNSLDLQVRISKMRPDQLARVSQLTQRTNQFNVSTIRRSERDLQVFCESNNSECLVVEASDRFGDYGLVGVMLFTTEGNAITVDTFLLSCRALGRGIEHRMLATLGEIAQQRMLASVDLNFIRSGKNQPALDFLTTASGNEGNGHFSFPATVAAALTYNPDGKDSRNSSPRASTGLRARPSDLSLFKRIVSELSTVEQVVKAIDAQKKKTLPRRENVIAPRTLLEMTIVEIWKEVLGLDQISIDDDFFALGGHSLLATLMLSRLYGAFGVELALHDFFDAPTVVGLAALAGRHQVEQSSEQEIADMLRELEALSDEEVKALLASETA